MQSPFEKRTPSPGPRSDLSRQYGEIGISAVQAALYYRAEAKNHAYAPVKPKRVETSELETEAG